MGLKRIPILKSGKIRAAITIGDPSGIGPAITLKALSRLGGLADFTVFGDSWVLSRARGRKCLSCNAKFVDLKNIKRKDFSFGRVRAEYAAAAIEYLDAALEMLKDRQLDCLVTCPISKEAVNLAGYKFSGHTEYLAEKTNSAQTAMMLLNRRLRFSLLTRHIPIKDVPLKLNKEMVYKNIKITTDSLKRLFLIPKPRIVVCGLNPHGSDNGLIGREENEIIKPAIKESERKLKIKIAGPMPADSAIKRAAEGNYDLVIAIYHDQALIPLKLTSADSGVNLTLGLPFIRTSPLHGTAFDIAGNHSLIKPDSLIAAVKLAIMLCKQNKDCFNTD